MDSANAASVASTRNKGSLAQRVISALILLPIVIGVVWWSAWSVLAIVALATALGLVELCAALRHGGYRPSTPLALAIGLAALAALALKALFGVDLIGLVLTLAIVGSLVLELRRHHEPGVLASWSLALAGALYLSWLLSHFVLLRLLISPLNTNVFTLVGLSLDAGAAWIYLILAITWIQDTAAYFVGKNFGRHKLAPVLSPKKTWEGAAGGMLGSIVAAIAFAWVFGLPLGWAQAALLGLVGGVVGPLGDLAESMIKRQVGLKDAGNLIPGHGGILDRLDSFWAVCMLLAVILYATGGPG